MSKDLKKEIEKIANKNVYWKNEAIEALPTDDVDIEVGFSDEGVNKLLALFKKHRKDYCDGVIGEDENEKWYRLNETDRIFIRVRNKLRAEQRGRNEGLPPHNNKKLNVKKINRLAKELREIESKNRKG